jgi:hypothetical protein
MNCVLLYGHSLAHNLFKPAGPFRLATALRSAGFTTACVDVAALEVGRLDIWDAIIDKFVDKDTLWLGVSTTFMSHVLGVPVRRLVTYDQFVDKGTSSLLEYVTARCRARNPGIRFIVGGAAFINLEKHGFYSITGYADTELVEFTRNLADPSFRPSYARLGKRIEGKEYADFATSEIDWTDQDIMRPGDNLPLEVSRGCIFRCKFCAFPLNGKTKGEWVKRTDVLVRELTRNYERWGITQYTVCDDTFNDSTEKLRELHDAFVKLPFELDLTAYLRLDLLMRFPEQVKLLRGMGLRCALFGIETVNSKSAKAIGKGVPFEQQIAYLWKLKAAEFKDVLISSGFILGLPFDTKQTLEDTQSFLFGKDNPLDHWSCVALGINPVNDSRHKRFFSEFDLEYEKYGYVLDPPTESKALTWTLGELTYDMCDLLAANIDRVSRTLPNFKYGSFLYSAACHVMPKEELHAKSISELTKIYDVPALRAARVEDYYKRLLAT